MAEQFSNRGEAVLPVMACGLRHLLAPSRDFAAQNLEVSRVYYGPNNRKSPQLDPACTEPHESYHSANRNQVVGEGGATVGGNGGSGGGHGRWAGVSASAGTGGQVRQVRAGLGGIASQYLNEKGNAGGADAGLSSNTTTCVRRFVRARRQLT